MRNAEAKKRWKAVLPLGVVLPVGRNPETELSNNTTSGTHMKAVEERASSRDAVRGAFRHARAGFIVVECEALEPSVSVDGTGSLVTTLDTKDSLSPARSGVTRRNIS